MNSVHKTIFSAALLMCLLFVTNGLKAQNVKVQAVTGYGSSSLDSVAVDPGISGYLCVNDTVRRPVVFLDVYSRFDPVNPVDTSLEPSARWYNFILKGIRNRAVIMNFHHSEAESPFFAYLPENGEYPSPEDFHRFPQENILGSNRVLALFDEVDSVMISYFIPYTYEYLQKRIQNWVSSGKVEVLSAGKSLEGRDMPMLRITDPSVSDSQKKSVYMHARTHTSEAPCSWHLDFLITRLLDAENPHSREMLKNIVFHIVPFANPDGVADGLSRSNASGINQEINWDRPMDSTAVEVRNLKAVLDSLYSVQHVDMALNLHSQISPFATYWVHTAESTSEEFFEDEMRFARLTTHDNIYMYPEDLSFSALKPRYVEGWIWNRVREKTLAITFETTYMHFSRDPEDEDSVAPEVSLESLEGLAERSAMAIGDYFGVSMEDRKIVKPTGRFGKKKRCRLFLEGGKSYRISSLSADGEGGWTKVKELSRSKSGEKKIRLPRNCEAVLVETL